MSLRTLLVIPAYRESTRLPAYLRELLPDLQKSGSGIDVLVVDDGSGPAEVESLQKSLDPLLSTFPQLLPPLLLPFNQGKGAAIREGWNQVRDHRLLAFVDADGSISASELLRIFSLVNQDAPGNPALFSSRIKMLGHTIERHFHRHLMGRIYATLIGLLLEVPVYDSQCGFKIIPAEAWPRIRADLSENGFAFDVDLLLALQKQNIAIREIPIDWKDIEGSKVRLLRDSFRMFNAILRLRRRYHR